MYSVSGYDFDVRPNGGSSFPDMYSKHRRNGNYCIVAIDGSDLAEAKISNAGMECS
jgi:hypothetical protein